MQKILRTCPICGLQYEADPNRLKHGRQTTCSKVCSYNLRSDKSRKGVTLECSNCGAGIIRSPSQIKSKHGNVFCSMLCKSKAMRKGVIPHIITSPYNIKNPVSEDRKRKISSRIWETRRKNGTDRHTKETIRKLSEITTENIVRSKINRISKIEYEVADKLTSIGVKFIHQHGIRDSKTGRYCASIDFYLPDFNIAVEVNGTFWHSDPRFYDRNSLTPAQIRTQTRFERKVSILNSLNITLMEIWEHDIKTFPNSFIDPLVKIIT